jgi:hypothetical protein
LESDELLTGADIDRGRLVDGCVEHGQDAGSHFGIFATFAIH